MADTPTIFTAHDVPDLLNALPTLFGFRLSESLVAVATNGSRRRFGFRLRVDIPAAEHVAGLAGLVVGHLRHQGAEGAVLVALTDQQEIARALLEECCDHLAEIELVVAVRADGSRYWVAEEGFPAEGIAYETSDHHLSIVQAVAAGQQILPDRDALAARFKPVEGPQRRRMTLLSKAVREELGRLPTDELLSTAMVELPATLRRGLPGGQLDEEELVRLSVWLSHPEVLTEVWSWVSPDNAVEMLSLLTHVSGVVVPPHEAAVLSLAGFAAWLTGDGAQSLIAVERALGVDPHHPLASGVLALLEGGVSPVHWGRI